jgi:hypothetical protein
MASPFPGMDPYLEDKALWNDVHHRLITYISNALQRQVRPRYHVRIEERLYVEEAKREIVPDTAVLQPVGSRTGTAVAQAPECDAPIVLQVETREHTEGVIHILDRARNMRVVTVIEVLSPSNKEPHSKGWELYRQKQGEILRSDVHLVEIDLLRAGEYTLAPPYHVLVGEVGSQWHYMMSIRRADDPENFLLYPRTIRERLPRIPVPLAIGDREACLDLQAVLDQCYEDGAYEDIVDYRRDPPPPPLSADDLEWLYLRLRQLGRR